MNIKQRLNAKKARLSLVTVTLEEADLQPAPATLAANPAARADPALLDFVGLSVTIKTGLPMSFRLKVIAAANMSDKADPAEQVATVFGMIEAYAHLIEDWNLDDGEEGVPMPISTQGLLDLPQVCFDAVILAVSKALNTVALSPNSKAS